MSFHVLLKAGRNFSLWGGENSKGRLQGFLRLNCSASASSCRMLFIRVCKFVHNPNLIGKFEFSFLWCRCLGFHSVATLQLAPSPAGMGTEARGAHLDLFLFVYLFNLVLFTCSRDCSDGFKDTVSGGVGCWSTGHSTSCCRITVNVYILIALV